MVCCQCIDKGVRNTSSCLYDGQLELGSAYPHDKPFVIRKNACRGERHQIHTHTLFLCVEYNRFF